MKSPDLAFYGSYAQRALLQRGADMHSITRDQKHLTYYGRTVGVTSIDDAPLSTMLALARLQGNSNIADVADADMPDHMSTVREQGFSPVDYAKWKGSREAIDLARATIANYDLPAAYRMEWLDPRSSAALRKALADTCLSCSVLPPSLAVLSGETQPGVCAIALHASGEVAGCAAAASYLHPEHPDGRTVCWWGMLAVHPDHRGQALSLYLGAEAIVEMHKRYGFAAFFTGVEPGNAPSEAICTKMGLAREGRSILGAADASLIPGGRMTK